MRNLTITVGSFGKATTDSTQLGYSGEHNATQLTVLFDADVRESYSQIDFFRIVIDGMYSDKLYLENGKIIYSVPQSCMKPPAVHCQLVGYKSTDGEPKIIIKSEVVTLNVERSEVSLYPEDTNPSLIERAMEKCDNAVETAISNANRSEAAVNSALEAVDKADKNAALCIESAKQAGQHAESASKSAEVLEKAVYDYRNIANALRRTTRGKRGTLKDVSPLEHEVKIQMTADDMSIFNTAETVSIAEFMQKDDTVMLNTPSDSVHIVLESGHNYTVSGVIPLVDGQDLTKLADFSELAISPNALYSEGLTRVDLTYTIADKVLSWVSVYSFPLQPDAEGITLSGSYMLETAGQKITGFCQIFGLDESNPNFQNPELDTLHTKIMIDSVLPSNITLTVGGKNLIDPESMLNAGFTILDDGTYYCKNAGVLRNKILFENTNGYTGQFTFNVTYKWIPTTSNFVGGYFTVVYTDGTTRSIYNQNKPVFYEETTYTFTTPEDKVVDLVRFGYATGGTETYIKDAQIEYGSTATEYEPYVEPVTYVPEVDGTVKGVKSIYPSMSFSTNNSDVWLNIEYNRDLIKVIQNLENAIIATGGNL